MDREAHVVTEVRRAVRLFNEGKVDDAGARWDAFADSNEPLLQPHRLTWARARVRWTLGRWDEAAALLAALDSDDTPFDVRAHALVARGWAADRADRREDAVRLYRQALAYLDTRPEYNHQFTIAPARSWASAGLKTPRTEGAPQETRISRGCPDAPRQRRPHPSLPLHSGFDIHSDNHTDQLLRPRCRRLQPASPRADVDCNGSITSQGRGHG
jgi:tetratricopeptide (TPR) repeat protein